MTSRIALATLFLVSLAGALVEGLWSGVPTVLVQFNGLVLLVSALWLVTAGARTLISPTNRRRSTP